MTCPHCAGPADGEVALGTALGTPTVALVGNPNVGKSSLFNTATRGVQQTRNAPGTTVEMHTGRWEEAGVQLVDLPGTYSLVAGSPDERVTAEYLGAPEGERPRAAVVILDATSLLRSLYLLGQVAATGIPVACALTMADVARAEGGGVAAARIAQVLGVPVVPLDPRQSVAGLADAVHAVLVHEPAPEGGAPRGLPAEHWPDDAVGRAEALFAWVDGVREELGLATPPAVPTRSDRIDRVLLHPWVGLPLFGAVLWALFQLVTSVAAPLMAWAEALVSGPVAGAAAALLGWLGLGGGAIEGLLVDGVIAGVGTVASFAPLMAIMFAAIAVLDDSGYLARVAFVADRAMRAIGLDGRAVLPLILGFGCNVPAVAATRALPDARHRIAAAVMVPWTSCAARLTVYLLLAAAFFPGHAGTVIFALYLISVLLVVLAGLVMRRLTGERSAGRPLLLVLPPYQLPLARALGREVWDRTRGFILGAGRVIVATLTAVWVLMAVPTAGDHPLGDVPVRDSLYGTVAAGVAPAFAPAGFDNWQSTAALMTGFVAKEVVVGSFAQSFAVDEPETAAAPSDLGTRLAATFEDSSGGHGAAAALAFMVFVLAYTPCLATLAEQRRVIGTRVTVLATGAQLAAAWLLAVATFQLFRLWW